MCVIGSMILKEKINQSFKVSRNNGLNRMSLNSSRMELLQIVLKKCLELKLVLYTVSMSKKEV
jgi:hypothetical protein